MGISITEEDNQFVARFTNKLLRIVGYGDTRLEAVTNLMEEVPDYSLKELSKVL